MSHELRTPLNAIIGYTALVREESEDLEVDFFDEELGRVDHAARHLLDLINDVLDLSKIEAERMELHPEHIEVDGLCEGLRATIEPMCEANATDLIIDHDPDVRDLHADRTRLRQVLLNLLSNAAKFTEEGEVRLEITALPEDQIALRVHDTGIGMDEEELARIFESFIQASATTTRDFGGTGLGLPISRKLCEMMGGSLTATSEPGVGSTFTVTLPRQAA